MASRDAVGDRVRSGRRPRRPLGRGGREGELDQAVLYLLGSGSSFVTGHVLSVDGGMAVR